MVKEWEWGNLKDTKYEIGVAPFTSTRTKLKLRGCSMFHTLIQFFFEDGSQVRAQSQDSIDTDVSLIGT